LLDFWLKTFGLLSETAATMPQSAAVGNTKRTFPLTAPKIAGSISLSAHLAVRVKSGHVRIRQFGCSHRRLSIRDPGLNSVPLSAAKANSLKLVTQRELVFSACCRMHISPNASMSVQAAASSST
jgi:hypothetical protein